MHYVVKSGHFAAMRGALKRKTVCPSIVVAPRAQLSGVSNDRAFFFLVSHGAVASVALQCCNLLAIKTRHVSVSREAIPDMLRSVGWCLVVHGSPVGDRRSVTCSRVNFPCSAGRGISSQHGLYSLEQQDVWLRLVDLVVLPAQTLCDAQASPLVFPQQLEGASRAIKVVLGDGLEHLLGELDVAVLVVVIVVPARTRIIVSARSSKDGSEAVSKVMIVYLDE